MKALILAAGYATRLYPLTVNKPKTLLKVGKKAILDHLVDKIDSVKKIKEILVVTNDKFYSHLVRWKNNLPLSTRLKPITIINDGSNDNADRLGAVGDIDFVLQKKNIADHLLVVAGDNLFEFSLQDFVNHFQENSLVAFHDLKDLEEIKGSFGVGILEGLKVQGVREGPFSTHSSPALSGPFHVINFEEKPQHPKSTLVSTACYLFHKNDLPLITLLAKKGKVDNTGNLVKWLVEKSTVQGYIFTEKWFDIGTLEALREAQQVYER